MNASESNISGSFSHAALSAQQRKKPYYIMSVLFDKHIDRVAILELDQFDSNTYLFVRLQTIAMFTLNVAEKRITGFTAKECKRLPSKCRQL